MEYPWQDRHNGDTSSHHTGDGYTASTEQYTEGQSHHDGGQHESSEAVSEGLDALMSDDSDEPNYDDAESSAEAGESEGEDESEGEATHSEPIPIPHGSRNDAVFSERDVYRILNSVTALESQSKEMGRIIDLVLSIGGNNVRRAITLVKMDRAEFDDKTVVVEVLSAIADMSRGESDNPIQAVLTTVSRVSGLDEAQKASMVSLARRLIREAGGTQRVRSPKNASDVEIVQDIQAAMTGENSIAGGVVELGKTIASLVEAAK